MTENTQRPARFDETKYARMTDEELANGRLLLYKVAQQHADGYGLSDLDCEILFELLVDESTETANRLQVDMHTADMMHLAIAKKMGYTSVEHLKSSMIMNLACNYAKAMKKRGFAVNDGDDKKMFVKIGSIQREMVGER